MWKIIILLLLSLAACQGGQSQDDTTQHAKSETMLNDLPFSVAQQDQRQLPTALPDVVITDADAEHLLLNNVYERITPSVVNIEVVVPSTEQVGFSRIGRGSGFVYDIAGHIITNAHVIRDAEEIRVKFDDGYVAIAELVGEDIFSDIAVVRVDVDAERLFPLELADSDLLRVGDRAIAIGNPFGLNSSMTVGIVSGLGRQLSSAALIDDSVLPGFQNPNIIQVDTDINPGNSGGPLLNSRGQVIGVNTAIRTNDGIFDGVGFAVPANTVGRVVPELIADGQVDYSWMGITTLNAELSIASLVEPLGLPVDSGVLVTGIMNGSPAAEAGLIGGSRQRFVLDRAVCAGGDIIVAVDGHYVANMDELVAYLVIETVPGDTVVMLIVRDGETFEAPLTLGTRPAEGVVVPACGR
jgi:2-alkenal reductase